MCSEEPAFGLLSAIKDNFYMFYLNVHAGLETHNLPQNYLENICVTPTPSSIHALSAHYVCHDCLLLEPGW